jgi:hypothetical protein
MRRHSSTPWPDPTGEPDGRPGHGEPPQDQLTPDQRAFARLLGRLLSEQWAKECKSRAPVPPKSEQ